MAIAEKGCHQAGEQIRQTVALSFLAARVRKGSKEFKEAAQRMIFQQLLALAIREGR